MRKVIFFVFAVPLLLLAQRYSLNEVVGLQAALDAKADAATVSSLQTSLAAKADGNDPRFTDARTPSAHQHVKADVTDLGTPASVVASGTATFANGALAAGAQSGAAALNFTSGSAGAVLATDTVIWSYNSLPTAATDARLYIYSVVGAGTLAFHRTNTTASSITGTSRAITFMVIRRS